MSNVVKVLLSTHRQLLLFFCSPPKLGSPKSLSRRGHQCDTCMQQSTNNAHETSTMMLFVGQLCRISCDLKTRRNTFWRSHRAANVVSSFRSESHPTTALRYRMQGLLGWSGGVQRRCLLEVFVVGSTWHHCHLHGICDEFQNFFFGISDAQQQFKSSTVDNTADKDNETLPSGFEPNFPWILWHNFSFRAGQFAWVDKCHICNWWGSRSIWKTIQWSSTLVDSFCEAHDI